MSQANSPSGELDPSDIRNDTNGSQPPVPQWLKNWCDINGWILVGWSPKRRNWSMIQRTTHNDLVCSVDWTIEDFLKSLDEWGLQGWNP